ncbi:MAG: hypothetical protein GX992_02680 [Clostridium sp.]|nr:hypothetical protein [Clostridium sp.]
MVQKRRYEEEFKKQIVALFNGGKSFIGHFCETKETMEETLDLIKKMYLKYKADIALFFNTQYPRTWQFTHKDVLGIRIVASEYSTFTSMMPIVETDEFTVNDQRNIYYEALNYCGRSFKIDSIKNE